MDKSQAGAGIGQDSVLEVRVELVDSEPKIWRRFELRGSLVLSQVHQVLQAAFGWEDAHLHRFVLTDPFAPLLPVDGAFPEVPQWLPGQECEEPADRPEEDCSLDQLLTLGSGGAFYEYDFGDSWLHRLELVSRRPVDDDSPSARLRPLPALEIIATALDLTTAKKPKATCGDALCTSLQPNMKLSGCCLLSVFRRPNPAVSCQIGV